MNRPYNQECRITLIRLGRPAASPQGPGSASPLLWKAGRVGLLSSLTLPHYSREEKTSLATRSAPTPAGQPA